MLAVIGGSGLYTLGTDFEIARLASRQTPYGDTSAEIQLGRWQGCELAFLPRHGPGHTIPPHRVNYRANLWSLHELGVERLISVNAVGGIASELAPCRLALPDQLIDYTSGRAQSFFDGESDTLRHVDFTEPYSASLRALLGAAANSIGLRLVAKGTYGCTNGPRLETAAEIRRLRNDGCSLVGMTGMPEAALARELGIEYASLALVVNRAAGLGTREIQMDEILANLEQGMKSVLDLLREVAKRGDE